MHNYIELYKNELPHEVLDLYCRNDVVNAVISYYAGVSRDNGIQFDVKTDYPELSSITAVSYTHLDVYKRQGQGGVPHSKMSWLPKWMYCL